MTTIERPLRALMDYTKKNRTLHWNPSAEESFHNARDTSVSCPALFFVDEHATIIVMTDASDYGVGSYIFQVIDGKEKPIIFFPHRLTDEVHLRISQAHNSEVGHFGVDKTRVMLATAGKKWKHMRVLETQGATPRVTDTPFHDGCIPSHGRS